MSIARVSCSPYRADFAGLSLIPFHILGDIAQSFVTVC